MVVISGAGSGLGRELSLVFAQTGFNVAICDCDEYSLNETMQLIANRMNSSHLDYNVLSVVTDVAVEEDVQRLVKAVMKQFNRIDVLINNAAVFENYSLQDMSLQSWEYQINNNLTSVFLMTKHCLSFMRQQKKGKIVNITSSLAKGGAGFGAYAASKAAVEALTTTIDEEEGRHGIHCFAVNPGIMRTKLQALGEDPSVTAQRVFEIIKDDNTFNHIIDVGEVIN